MKLLFVNNSPPCGVADFGELTFDALVNARCGIELTYWKADYPKYLPEDAAAYDVIYLNWHPGTLNHIRPEHIPAGPLLVVYFHESTHDRLSQGLPDIWTRANVRFVQDPLTCNPALGTYYFETPCPNPNDLRFEPPQSLDRIFIGTSGLRADGLDRLLPLAEKHGWVVSKSGDRGWLSTSDELHRLEACHFNVAHYHTGAPGESGGVMKLVASLRPLLINSNPLLKNLHRYGRGDWDWPELYLDDDLERGCLQVIRDLRDGSARRPFNVCRHRVWSRRIWDYIGAIERHCDVDERAWR